MFLERFHSEWFKTAEQLHVTFLRVKQIIAAVREPHTITYLPDFAVDVFETIGSVSLYGMKGHPVTVKNHSCVAVYWVIKVLPYSYRSRKRE